MGSFPHSIPVQSGVHTQVPFSHVLPLAQLPQGMLQMGSFPHWIPVQLGMHPPLDDDALDAPGSMHAPS
jgi:hypothetical protein